MTRRHRRGGTTKKKAMDDEAKFVRDSRDEARERRLERDTGRSMTDVETFVDALVSEEEESESTSSVTRALNEEFGTGRGAVRVRDGRGGATKATLTHPSGAYADVYLRGGNVCSWVLASGGEVFYVPERADFKSTRRPTRETPRVFPPRRTAGSRVAWSGDSWRPGRTRRAMERRARS